MYCGLGMSLWPQVENLRSEVEAKLFAVAEIAWVCGKVAVECQSSECILEFSGAGRNRNGRVTTFGEDMEKWELESETREGASPSESGIDTSELEGEVSGGSILL